jgi:Domain of unknown function (DUF1772)
MFSISIMAIPAFLEASAPTALKQFDTIYQIGKVSTPPSCVFTAATFFYLSYCSHPSLSHSLIESRNGWKEYLVAGACAGMVLPFTYIVLEKTSQELLHLEHKNDKALDEEGNTRVDMLLRRWKILNLVRSVMLVASAIVGFYSTLG